MMARRWRRSAPCPPGYQRHHLIPRAVVQRPQFAAYFAELERAGARLCAYPANGLALPADERLAVATGQALHRGPHPAYTDVVMARVEQIRASSSLADRRASWLAADRVATLQVTLRRALTDRHGHGLWLNRRDPMRIFADRDYLDAALAALFAEG